MKKTKESESLIYEFGSWREFIEYTRPYRKYLRTDNTWSAGTPDENDRMADEGWLEGAAVARKFYDAQIDALGDVIEKQEMYYDVEGQIVDVGRVATGEPECCMNFETVRVEQSSPRFMRIVVNVAASAGVDADVILARGGVLAALVELLEQSGIRCEVAVVDATRGGGLWYCTTMTVKQYDEPLDLPIVAYAIGHAGTLRHHIFRLVERMGIEHGAAWKELGYGCPDNVPEEQRGDLYAECMSWGSDQWTNEAKASAWILAQLAKAGVALKTSATQEHRS